MDQPGYREQSIPEGINLARLLRYSLPRMWVVLLVGVVCAGVALIWALYIIPEYKGITRFEILSEQDSVSMAAQLQGLAPGGFLGGENKGRPEVVRVMGIDLSRETVHKMGLEILVIDPRDTFWGRAKEKVGGKLGMPVRPPVDLAPVRLAEISMADRYDGHMLHLVPTGGGSFELRDPEGMFGAANAVIFSGREGARFDEDELTFTIVRVPQDKGLTYELLLRREAEWLRDFRSRIKAGTDRNATHIISVEFNHPYPEIAREALRLLVEGYTARLLEQRGESQKKKLAWIDEGLKPRREELAAAQQAFYDFREEKKAIEFTTQTQMLVEQIAGYDAQVAQTEFTRRGYDSMLRALDSGNEADFLASPFVAQREDELLAGLVQDLTAAQVERESLLLTLTEKHSSVLEAESKIAELRSAIRTHIENSRSQLDRNLADIRGKQGSLLGDAEKLPAVERELLELTRDYEKKMKEVEFLEQLRTDTEISLAALTPNVRFIDQSEVGRQPYKPRVMMSVVAGACLGLGAGVVALFFMFLGHSQVFDEEDAAEAGPLLAVLTSRNAKARLALLAGVVAGRGGGAGILLHNSKDIDASGFAEALYEKARSLGRRPLGLLGSGNPLSSAVGKPVGEPPLSFSIADSEGSLAALGSNAALNWLRESTARAEVAIAGPPSLEDAPLGQQIATALGSCSLLAVRGLSRRSDLVELARQLRLGGVHVVGVVLVDKAVLKRD